MKDILKELRAVEEKYKDYTHGFGEIRIADMARDAANEIERLQNELSKYCSLGKVEGTALGKSASI